MQVETDLRGAVAYSYARFSDPSQGDGHSLERQQEYAPEFCREYGCKLDTTLSFSDQGKSAFHGRHVAEGGGLLRFVQCIEAGRVKAGDILIVENLDRMSRLPLEGAEDLLKSILSRGVRIHTRSPWAIYDRATMNDPMQRMQMIFEFTRSHRESKYKQERLTRRWTRNREEIKKGNYHMAMVPGWLKVMREKGKVVGYETIPEHAETVVKIFEWCCDGVSVNGIVKRLNAEGVKPMGRAGYWVRSSVAKLVHNRAVIGEYQPFSSVKTDGREIISTKRVPVGDPVKNHFPRLVSDDVFNRAQLATEKRRTIQSGAGENKVTNLFAGMLVDARDGSTMQVADKGYGPQLVSNAARSGVIDAAYIPYAMIEQSMVVFASEMPLDMVTPSNGAELDKKIKQLRKEVESLELQVSKIKAKTRENTSDALLELLVERDVELKSARQEVETLERQRSSSATVAVNSTKKLLALIKNASPNELLEIRAKIRNEIRYWMKRMTILPLKLGGNKAAMVDVELVNGAHYEFRCTTELVEWPKGLDGRSVLDFAKWPKGIRKTEWEAVSDRDRKIIELSDEGKSIQEIADTVGEAISVVSRRLIANGRRRAMKRTLGGDRQMTWNSQSNGWQRRVAGKRYYVGCGTLKELYPRLVKSMDEAGTLKAANRWWTEHGVK